MLAAGEKINVIPGSASAQLDCRLLPGDDAGRFVATVKHIIDDPAVHVHVVLNFPSASSPTDTAFYAALRRLAAREHTPIVPAVLAGFTDSHYFREKGIASYGFNPFAMTAEEAGREHGINERLSTKNLREGIRRIIELLQILNEVTPDGQSQIR